MSSTVEIVVGGGDADPAEQEEDVLDLRRELLDLDVDDVRRSVAGEAPAGAKGVEALLAGSLVVTLGQETVKALVAAAVDWLKRRRGGASGGIRIQVGDDVLALADGTSAEDRALIAAFLARHEATG